jgi:site-specific recombinase XerD
MNNANNLSDMISQTILRLQENGYHPATIVNFKRTYAMLQRHCVEKNIENYDETIGDQFINAYKLRHNNVTEDAVGVRSRHICQLNTTLLKTQWKPAKKATTEYAKSRFDNHVAEYESYLFGTGKTVRNVRCRLHVVARFLKFIDKRGQTTLQNLSAEDIYEAFRESSDNKHTFRKFVIEFLKYAYKYGITDSKLYFIMPSVQAHKAIPSVYSPTEIEQLLNCVDRTTKIGKRNYAIMLIAARLGLRACDIATLTFDCLCEITSTIKIAQTKNKRPLKLPLLPDVKDAIDDYVNNARPISQVNQIFLHRHRCDAISSEAISGIARSTFGRSAIDFSKRRRGSHSLRASLATALLEEGNDFIVIQRALGHGDIESTKSYAKASVEQLRTNAISVPLPSGNFEKLLAGGKV